MVPNVLARYRTATAEEIAVVIFGISDAGDSYQLQNLPSVASHISMPMCLEELTRNGLSPQSIIPDVS